MTIPQVTASALLVAVTAPDRHTEAMSCEVRLSTSEFCDAVDTAAARIRASARQGLNHANVRNRTITARLHDDMLGACAELAVAKWVGVPWSKSVNTFHDVADVGDNLEIRSTTSDYGSLIVRPNDAPYRWYVLVSGRPPRLSILGYLWGGDAMQPHYWRNAHGYRGAWFVPQSDLLPIPADGTVPAELRQPATATA